MAYMVKAKTGEPIDNGAVATGAPPGGDHPIYDRGPDGSMLSDMDERLLDTWWDDLRVPGHTVKLGAAAPDWVTFKASNIEIPAFAGSITAEEVHFEVQLPHRYQQGFDIYPHIHYTPTTTGSGTVIWQLDYSWANAWGDFPDPTTVRATGVIPSNSDWTHRITGFGALDGSNKLISSMLVCRLFRDPDDGDDDYAADAGFLEFDIHFPIDSPGSRLQYTK